MCKERFVEVGEDNMYVSLLGLHTGKYTVHVGEYGWDDGDLFIESNIGRIKLRELKIGGDVSEIQHRGSRFDSGKDC